VYGGMFFTLFAAYYVWDTSQSQKARFRLQLRGTYKPRWTFPQLPWGTLTNPEYIVSKDGSTLLTDGWFKYARKIYYFADFIMASSWGLSCGFSGFLPFFYPIFFGTMLTHRYFRDVERCKEKYGETWDLYCSKVKYALIPYVL
jgi:delta24(24(1))-sterol reductase